MSEDEKSIPTWAPIDELRKKQSVTKEEEKYMEALQNAPLAQITLLQEIVVELQEIKEELKYANLEAFGDTSEAEIEATPPSPSVPENLDDEEKMVSYTKKLLRQVQTRGGEKFTDDELDKFEFAVEENKVLIKPAWTSKAKWAATRDMVEKQGGEWRSDGKNSRFELPIE